MKIFNASQIKKADAITILNEPISSLDLMERAASRLGQQIILDFKDQYCFHIFCGAGNNGGDGLVLARYFINEGKKVFVYIVHSERYSHDFEANLQKLKGYESLEIRNIAQMEDMPIFNENDYIIDAILGIGLNKPINGWIEKIIQALNDSPAYKISVDVPTGLMADEHSDGVIFKADKTYTFQWPKLAFMMPQNNEFVGDWKLLDIGLSKSFEKNEKSIFYYIDKQIISEKYRPRSKFSHKGTFGHAYLIAGSKGKIGAAVLAAKGALRSGLGLLTVHVPICGIEIMQISVAEAMVSESMGQDFISDLFDGWRSCTSIGIGPGLGKQTETSLVLKDLICNYTGNLVVDADAIIILAANKDWLVLSKAKMILTPHPKEFERLVGKWKNDFEKIELQKNFAKHYNSVVVLKGAHTSIALPDGTIYFNSTGNNGMASGGFGDVLTGIILGLLASGYSNEDSAIIGVYLHGLAADLALDIQSEESLLALDIIDYLGRAFKEIKNNI